MPKFKTDTESKPRFSRETADVRKEQLVKAATRCLAENGIAGFTIDNISRQAKVSRGLINHHFDGINGLLAAVYLDLTESMYRHRDSAALEGSGEDRLAAVIETMFRPPLFAKEHLRAWLALWSEVATNPQLKSAHRRSYGAYRTALAAALSDTAKAHNVSLDAEAFAITLIALIDGLWIEWCLDAAVINRDAARAAIYDVIESKLGAIPRLRRSM